MKQVTNDCESCAATKTIPKETLEFTTTTKPTSLGTFFNADVLVESSQKILVIRDNLTSFTEAMFIQNEQKPTLRNSLVIVSSKLRSTGPISIRTDPHSSLKALVKDRMLSEKNITLELGSPKNVNKNAVAEKAIQELLKELLIVSSMGGKISDLTLAKAIFNLNTRIRHTGRSSRELWIRRDQSSHEPLAFHDNEISDQQYKMRTDGHSSTAKHESRNAPLVILPSVEIGDKVFVKSDACKSKARDPYLVLGVNKDDTVQLQKITDVHNRSNLISVHLQNVYKTPTSKVFLPLTCDSPNAATPALTNSPICFYCRNMHRYAHHSHLGCPFLAQVQLPPVPDLHEADESSDDDEEQVLPHIPVPVPVPPWPDDPGDPPHPDPPPAPDHLQPPDPSHPLVKILHRHLPHYLPLLGEI